MRAVIDAVKGLYFRCLFENGDLINVHKNFLPEGIKEGDVIKAVFSIDEDATKKQRELMDQYPKS